MEVHYFTFILTVLSLWVTFSHQAVDNGTNCPFLYLLDIQPFPDSEKFAGWDRGLDLVPGGHLAAEQINNRSDILPDHKLKVVDIDTEACGRSSLNKGLINFYNELVISTNNSCIVGVIGMVCSLATNSIARIAGHLDIGYIQMALSVSPQHRNTTNFPYLFHTLSSSSVFNKAVIAMMKVFEWRRVGLVHNSVSFYFLSTANDFVEQLQDSYPSAELVTRLQVDNSRDIIPDIFKNINDQEARITYWVVSTDQGAFSLCEAFRRKFLWPGYIYIMRFVDVKNVVKASEKTMCTQKQIEQALEGVYLLEYRLLVNDSTELYSGWSYGEFRQRYKERLIEEERINQEPQESDYANLLYDQVWTYALAINNSFDSIASQNLSFGNYKIGNTKTISNILKREIKKLSFQGASGKIEFSKKQEVPSFIEIYQFQNGTEVFIGMYDPFEQKVTFSNYGHIPADGFETVYSLLPSWLGGCMLTAQTLLFCLITVNMLLVICWRTEKDIKASSPSLSILIMLGCYLLCVAPFLSITQRMITVKNKILFSFMCSVNTWFESIGLDLILATLFLRLLRIYHIFKLTSTIKKYWSDEYLFMGSLAICLGKVILHVIWSATDLIHLETQREYESTAIPPYYRALLYCYSKSLGVWILLTLLYSGVLLLLVLFLAIQTRHIDKDGFKDTKKVNLFLFLLVIIFTITIPLSHIFNSIGLTVGVDVSTWIAYFSVAMICQICLFVPKLLPIALRKANIYGRNESEMTVVVQKSSVYRQD